MGFHSLLIGISCRSPQIRDVPWFFQISRTRRCPTWIERHEWQMFLLGAGPKSPAAICPRRAVSLNSYVGRVDLFLWKYFCKIHRDASTRVSQILSRLVNAFASLSITSRSNGKFVIVAIGFFGDETVVWNKLHLCLQYCYTLGQFVTTSPREVDTPSFLPSYKRAQFCLHEIRERNLALLRVRYYVTCNGKIRNFIMIHAWFYLNFL